jgi:hypothetical protein
MWTGLGVVAVGVGVGLGLGLTHVNPPRASTCCAIWSNTAISGAAHFDRRDKTKTISRLAS